MGSFLGLLLQREIQHRGKADGAENPQRILAKSGFRVPHCANSPLADILLPSKKILQPQAGA